MIVALWVGVVCVAALLVAAVLATRAPPRDEDREDPEDERPWM